VSSGTLVFAASGGITASESTAAGQSTLWFSVAAPVAQTNQTVGLLRPKQYDRQSSSSTWDARTLSFAGRWRHQPGEFLQFRLDNFSSGDLQFGRTSGLSISTAGSTISVYPVPLSAWDPYPILTGTATSSHAPALILVQAE